MKDKKGNNAANAFQKILNHSNRKPKKIQVAQGSEFHNSSFKLWFSDNNIQMYSTHLKENSVIAERFV